MQRHWMPFFIAICAGVFLAYLAAVPPSPRALNAPDSEFSSARAMEDVRIIAQKPHPTGSAENAKVRRHLQGRLEALGLEVSTATSTLGPRSLARLNRWSGAAIAEQDIHNIIGVLPGRDRSKPALLLMAHHDSVWGSPASADATLGLSSILEILRAVKGEGIAPRDIIVLFTDAEELGLVGARHFFKENPLRDKVGAIINFEARGAGVTANMFQTSAGNGNLAALYARAVKQPSTSSLSVFIYNVLPNDTDLTPALEKDYAAAYNIANIGRPEYYHSPKNDIASLEEGTLQHMGAQGLDLTRALLSAPEFPARKNDVVFFDVFGLFTVVYAPFWGWIFLGAGGVFYILSARRNMQGRSVLNGGVRGLAYLGLGGIALYGFNRLAGTGGKANYYDGLAAIGALHWLALFVVTSVFLLVFGRKAMGASERFGAALPLFALGIAGQMLAPTAAYFITLPLMMCGGASLAASLQNKTARFWLAVTAALAALITGYMASLGHLLMLGVGPDMMALGIVPAAIAACALLLLFPYSPVNSSGDVSGKISQRLAVLGLIAAVALALWIRLDPIAATVPLYS